MISAVCVDALNEKGKLGHEYCRGWFRKLEKSGMTGTAGQDLVSFGGKVKCTCKCHRRYEQ